MSGAPVPLAAIVQQLLAAFLASESQPLAAQRSLAQKLGALPVYVDLAGCFALRPTGELLFVPSDQSWLDVQEWTADIAPQWRTIALAAAAHQYPQLAVLLPRRPAGASSCAPCQGTGLRVEPQTKATMLCGECLGLGWPPPT